MQLFVDRMTTFIEKMWTFVREMPTFVANRSTFVAKRLTFVAKRPTFAAKRPTFIARKPTVIGNITALIYALISFPSSAMRRKRTIWPFNDPDKAAESLAWLLVRIVSGDMPIAAI